MDFHKKGTEKQEREQGSTGKTGEGGAQKSSPGCPLSFFVLFSVLFQKREGDWSSC